MEREIVRTTEQYNGVKFSNFPWYRDRETGELTFKLLDGIMCEDIANQIPSKIRDAVTVDFVTLDYEALLTETKSKHDLEMSMTHQELKSHEAQLLATIFGESD